MLGDIVRYNFFALDDASEETYLLDYAIVLDGDDENDNIKILPFTSRYNKDSIESFCIGCIPGFVEVKNEGYVNNRQYVHFNKVLEVDKAELYPVHHQDVYGRVLRNNVGNPMNVALAEEQLDRIMDKYGIYEEGEEKNLINLLKKSHATFTLNSDQNNIEELREVCGKEMEKYREYNFNDKKIVVFFVDGERYSVVMRDTNNKDLDTRNNDLKEILS
ncbi:MAG: hypothetical protein RR561_02570 [Peptostreptococcus sp.]|uniref:hypothetical protein n=1 Tax=Peptostreptococcus sp. TaxID=1262 RepID=UPI002FCABEB7